MSVEYDSNTYESAGLYLNSCPDCVVWEDTMTDNQKGRTMYIFSEFTPSLIIIKKMFILSLLNCTSLIVLKFRSQDGVAGRFLYGKVEETGRLFRPQK